MRKTVLFLILFSFLLALIPLFLSIPPKTTFLRTLNDSGHTLLFVVISIAMMHAVQTFADQRYSKILWRTLFTYVTTGLSCLAIGIGIEVIQHHIGRSATHKDVILDAVGILSGMTLYAAWRIPRWYWKVCLVCIAFAGLCYSFWKPGKWLKYQYVRDHTLPILMNFDTREPRHFISRSYGAKLRFQKAPEEWTGNLSIVLKVDIPQRSGYPGFRMTEVATDWSPYTTFYAEVYSPEATPVTISVAMRDKKSTKDKKQFLRRISIEPGLNRISIPLSDIQQVMQDRSLDLKHMTYFTFYVTNPKHAITLFFDNIELQ